MSAAEPFEIRPGNTIVVLESILMRKGTDGILAVRDLSLSTSVKFSLVNAATGLTVIDEDAAAIVTPIDGLVRYTFSPEDVQMPGIYWYTWTEYITTFKASFPVRHDDGPLYIYGATESAESAYKAAVAARTGNRGRLVGFPSSLQIGDSYTAANGTAISLFMRDINNNPITTSGGHSIVDGDFAPTLLVRDSTRVIVASLTLIDPGGGGEKYLRVELPSEQTRRATPGTALAQCVLSWLSDHRTIATQEVTWLPRL